MIADLLIRLFQNYSVFLQRAHNNLRNVLFRCCLVSQCLFWCFNTFLTLLLSHLKCCFGLILKYYDYWNIFLECQQLGPKRQYFSEA